MIEHDDFRFGSPNYKPVTAGTFNSKEKQFSGDNGHIYRIFPDWSACDLTVQADVAKALAKIGSHNHQPKKAAR
jgi:hypothetical protein